ncbi:TetR family transcriptional regulator [Virgisporangium aliadipatigenens]|uniref:TetR family transcriptional regulator n=1 Tax=Virgisporangium aliadipatigenens TaxID=741659 RepID=A0A8J4DUJ2_9ACTN|nr:TetR family transcriptional regulator [Virgisporangium aliadipatigenens]GIJ51370.1 TetR family transcriptional regulator [Virgisporangium aliadipatigenens]
MLSETGRPQKVGLRARKREQTWLGIHAAALSLFAEHGFDAVSIDQIAAAANVARGTFFNYFDSKEELVVTYGPHEQEFQRRLMEQRPDGEPLWQSLVEIIVRYLEEFESQIVVHLRLKAGSPALSRSARPMTERLVADLRVWARDRHPHLAEAEIMLIINVAVAVLGTAVHYWQVDRPAAERIRTVRTMLDRAGSGLATPLNAST